MHCNDAVGNSGRFSGHFKANDIIKRAVALAGFSAKLEPSGLPFFLHNIFLYITAKYGTVKLGDKEHFDKEQIGVKEPFPVTNCQFIS